MLGSLANSRKMRVAQCKRMAESAIDIAAMGTPEQEAGYFELAADFLKLAHNIEDQHAGRVHVSAPDAACLERLAA